LQTTSAAPHPRKASGASLQSLTSTTPTPASLNALPAASRRGESDLIRTFVVIGVAVVAQKEMPFPE
jgi:hypothetical protein